MTINVAVKCPDGIVMGADSLITIPGNEEGSTISMVPYFTKLFEIKRFAAGVMINGVVSIGGRTIEDIIAEFGEKDKKQNPENYSLRLLAEDLQKILTRIVRANKVLIDLELIVGGYSKGRKAGTKRYGEIYSIHWETGRETDHQGRQVVKPIHPYPRFRSIYDIDKAFGTHYGGDADILDRFKYGIDERLIDAMWDRRELLFNQVRDFIIGKLKKKGMKIPNGVDISVPTLRHFDIYYLFSDYERQGYGFDLVNRVKEGMIRKLLTMEGYFSLQTAVNYCNFLMWCAEKCCRI